MAAALKPQEHAVLWEKATEPEGPAAAEAGQRWDAAGKATAQEVVSPANSARRSPGPLPT